MPVRFCRVTIQDMDGVSHTVEVTAATLYEAVAQGLAAIRGSEWVAGIAQGLNVVRVTATSGHGMKRGMPSLNARRHFQLPPMATCQNV